MMRVLVIGGGISGLAAARALERRARITLIERAPRLGGHAHTVTVPGERGPLDLDCGFIVFNRARYPRFSRMLRELGVATRASDMAFGVWSTDGSLAYSTHSASTLYARRASLLEPRHHRLVASILGFLARARRDLARGGLDDVCLGDYLAGAPGDLADRFVRPLARSLWSLESGDIDPFPAEVFLRFLHVHGMLRPVLPPRWRTVVGGSAAYVRRLAAELDAEVRLGAGVARLSRHPGGVEAELEDGSRLEADRVILATHTDQALAMLADPSDAERAALSAIRYRESRLVLHDDAGRLPPLTAARASWNVRLEPGGGVEVSYFLNRLQRIPGDVPYLVTLDPRGPINGRVLHRATMSHPVFDRPALAARRALARLQGSRRTYYAGAYLGWGFHEDGFRAGLAAATRLVADRAAARLERREAA